LIFGIDFLLSETRDLTSARSLFQKALAAPGHPHVDGNQHSPLLGYAGQLLR